MFCILKEIPTTFSARFFQWQRFVVKCVVRKKRAPHIKVDNCVYITNTYRYDDACIFVSMKYSRAHTDTYKHILTKTHWAISFVFVWNADCIGFFFYSNSVLIGPLCQWNIQKKSFFDCPGTRFIILSI